MPNARPGTGPRSAWNVGPAAGVTPGSMSSLDPGATLPSAPPPAVAPIPVPPVGRQRPDRYEAGSIEPDRCHRRGELIVRHGAVRTAAAVIASVAVVFTAGGVAGADP